MLSLELTITRYVAPLRESAGGLAPMVALAPEE